MDATFKRLLQDFLGFLVGIALLSLALIPSGFAIFIMPFALGCLAVVGFDFLLFLKIDNKLAKLNKDKRGLAWIWIAGLGLAIPLCALIYWALDYPFDLISEVALGTYTFTGTMASAWDLSRLVISYMLAFVVIYAVLWVIINSKNPSYLGG